MYSLTSWHSKMIFRLSTPANVQASARHCLLIHNLIREKKMWNHLLVEKRYLKQIKRFLTSTFLTFSSTILLLSVQASSKSSPTGHHDSARTLVHDSARTPFASSQNCFTGLLAFLISQSWVELQFKLKFSSIYLLLYNRDVVPQWNMSIWTFRLVPK